MNTSKTRSWRKLTPSLSDARYSRQYILPGFGKEGQEKLRQASVLVIGAGGLSCPALQYLVAAGVGYISMIDPDVVEESNLQRQVLYTTQDVGRLKVEVAQERLLAANSHCSLSIYAEKFCVHNARHLVSSHDIILDGSDNFPTRYLVNDACLECGKTFVAASLFQWEGQISVYNALQKDGTRGPSYRCLFPEPPEQIFAPNCSEAGVLGALAGILGAWQAAQVILCLLGDKQVLSGILRRINLASGEVRDFHFTRSSEAERAKILSEDNYEHIFQGNGCMINVKTIEPVELKKKLDAQEDIFLLDVREDEERTLYNIGGLHIRMGEVLARHKEIPRDKEVVVYCRSGGRSERAITELARQHGFTNLVNLSGGVDRWEEMGA